MRIIHLDKCHMVQDQANTTTVNYFTSVNVHLRLKSTQYDWILDLTIFYHKTIMEFCFNNHKIAALLKVGSKFLIYWSKSTELLHISLSFYHIFFNFPNKTTEPVKSVWIWQKKISQLIQSLWILLKSTHLMIFEVYNF